MPDVLDRADELAHVDLGKLGGGGDQHGDSSSILALRGATARSPTTDQRPCSESTAATMRPAAICACASAAPRASAAATSASGKGATARVTSRSPRSLSSRSPLAGTRHDARVVDVDRVGDDRRRRVCARRGRGEDGDAVGDAERKAPAAPARRGDAAHRRRDVDGEASGERRAEPAADRVGAHADVVALARAKAQRDVAAVVDRGADDARIVERREQLLGDAARDRGHRGDEAAVVAVRPACSDHPARDRAARVGRPGARGEVGTQQRQLGDELREERPEARRGALDRRTDRRRIARGGDDAVDRPVLEVPALAVEATADGSRRRDGAHRDRSSVAPGGHGTSASAPITRQPPPASTSSRRRTRSMWPPSAR